MDTDLAVTNLLDKIKDLVLKDETVSLNSIVDVSPTHHKNDLQILEYFQVYDFLKKKLDMITKVGYLRLFSEQDFKEYTKDGKLKKQMKLQCCDSTQPFAWKITPDKESKVFRNEGVCKKHARKICQSIMEEYYVECQCQQHCCACNQPWDKECSMCGGLMKRQKSHKMKFFCDRCKMHMTKKCYNCGECFQGNEKTLLDEERQLKEESKTNGLGQRI